MSGSCKHDKISATSGQTWLDPDNLCWLSADFMLNALAHILDPWQVNNYTKYCDVGDPALHIEQLLWMTSIPDGAGAPFINVVAAGCACGGCVAASFTIADEDACLA